MFADSRRNGRAVVRMGWVGLKMVCMSLLNALGGVVNVHPSCLCARNEADERHRYLLLAMYRHSLKSCLIDSMQRFEIPTAEGVGVEVTTGQLSLSESDIKGLTDEKKRIRMPWGANFFPYIIQQHLPTATSLAAQQGP